MTLTGSATIGGRSYQPTAQLELPPAERFRIGVDWSTAPSPEPQYFGTTIGWEGARCYKLGHAANAVTAWGVDRIGLSDDTALSATDAPATAAAIRKWAEDFWYGPGSAAREHVTVELGRNEIDREYKSGKLPDAVIETHRQVRAVCDTRNGDGTLRFPNLYQVVDATIWQVKTAGAAARFAPLAPFCHGYAASLYNPGREQTPVEWTPYAEFVDLMLDTAKSYGARFFSIWETGSPIGTRPEQRPQYFAGLLDYTLAGVRARGLAPGVACYWNRQTAATATAPAGPANQWKHDRQLAPNDTATTWRYHFEEQA